MKKTKSTAYSKATITFEDGLFFITEPGKKDEPDKVYCLSDELEEWVGEEGVSLSIKKDTDVEPELIIDVEFEDDFE